MAFPRDAITPASTCLLLVLLLALSGIAHASDRRALLDLVNEARVAADRAPLRLHRTLSRRAERHAARMAEAERLWHSDLLRTMRGIEGWEIAGENVGAGQTVRSILRAFLRSGPHRRNVLRRAFRRAGIGVARHDGTVWVAVVFFG